MIEEEKVYKPLPGQIRKLFKCSQEFLLQMGEPAMRYRF